MAGSCRDDGIDAIGSCLLGGLASLVTAGLLLSVVAAVVLWRLGVACGPLVPALGYFAGAALAWRLLWVFNDLQEVLGRSVVWVGVAAVPLLYPGLLLLVSRTGGRLVGLVEAAGVALLVAAFVGPGAVEGTEHRRFVASQREWLRSLPITIYEPVDLPAGYALASVEGRSSSPPQLKINLRAPGRSLSLIESVPYPAFAPPGRCGLGFPSDVVHDHPCQRAGAMPVRRAHLVLLLPQLPAADLCGAAGDDGRDGDPPFRAGLPERPEDELLRMLQSLRPVGADELADKVLD